eukprot:Gb_36869 [translate_table: standard]
MCQLLVKDLDGKTRCLQISSTLLKGADLKERLCSLVGIPSQFQRLVSGTREITDDGLLHAAHDGLFPQINLVLRLRAGKGGFGSLLRGAATKAGQKKTSNFDACRDMSGRRLRHVNAEKKLEEWKAEAEERQLEKIAEAYLKKQLKKKNIDRSDGAVKDLEKYRAETSRARDEVESAVKDGLLEAIKLQRNGKRKKVEEISVDAKRAKHWMLDEEDEEEVDNEEEDIDEKGGFVKKAYLVEKNEESGSSCTTKAESGSGSEIPCNKDKSECEASDDGITTDVVTSSGESGSACDERENSAELKKEEPVTSTSIEGQNAMHSDLVEADISSEASAGSCQFLPSYDQAGPSSEVITLLEGNENSSHRSDGFEGPLNFDDFHSAGEMEVLGLERLKNELQVRGLKCGGSLSERAGRLFLLKTTPLEKLPKKHFAKPKEAGK